ncbi:MAG: FG-GAP-like repeat-containing protein [Planctomycetaceae bacterium]
MISLLLFACLAIVVGGYYFFKPKASEDPEQILANARVEYVRENYSRAYDLAVQILEKDSNHSEAAMLAGRAASKQKRYHDAVKWFGQVSKENLEDYVQAQLAAADLQLFQLKRLFSAEKFYRRVLSVDPDNFQAHDRLAFLLGVTGQHWKRQSHLLQILKSGKFQRIHLVALVLEDQVIENPEFAQDAYRKSPEDPGPLVTLSRIALENRNASKAETLLKQAVKTAPNFLAAQVAWGRLLLDQNRQRKFLDWHAGLSQQAETHPGIWLLRGRFLEAQRKHKAAIRSYLESLRRDPLNRHAAYRVGTLLKKIGDTQTGETFLLHSRRIREYMTAVQFANNGNRLASLQRLAKLSLALNLHWEAHAWSTLAIRNGSAQSTLWAKDFQQKLGSIRTSLPLTRIKNGPDWILNVSLRNFPLPRLTEDVLPASNSRKRIQASIRFENDAEKAGLIFRYFNGLENTENGIKQMYASSGGGVAILDYDGDTLPDVYLSQGCRWPPNRRQTQHMDRLFRNLGNGQFRDVTEEAGLQENRFSQGVTAGDFNNDGYPDLFIANIGENRLYRNNGDGTFTDITRESEITGAKWSTSCLIADLNGDRHPDIYVVNYLTGPDIFTKVCRRGGRRVICHPNNFAGENDRLYLNLGDGRFRDVSNKAGIQQPGANGWGIVAADLTGSGKLSLFIANDSTANFHFVLDRNAKNGVPHFRDMALANGLAVNHKGQAEGCMGIAAGDVNGDGFLDFFVTNFDYESNTLFLSQSQNTFTDQTRVAGLHASSLPMVGFGTQFLDGDLDGDLDLMITNGHIDDFRPLGSGFRMPPQFHANDGRGNFSLQSSSSLGNYFGQKYLGRALARLDWNRDGRPDAIITHLDSPVALLTNATTNAGHFLAVSLRGTNGSRDAIGTTVIAELSDGRKLMRQLTAGDGYMASNERQLIFGLGNTKTVSTLTIKWPSGLKQIFQNLPANSRWLVVENQSRPLRLDKNYGRRTR